MSLRLGPAVGLASLAGVAVAGPRPRIAALVAVAGAGGVGLYDDLRGSAHARGLGGHARALRSGRVTTGMVKLIVLTSTAAVGVALRCREDHGGLGDGDHRAASGDRGENAVLDAALGTVLVAGTANLVNLFDLRPGRAAKVALLIASGLSVAPEGDARAMAAMAAGVALAALPADVGERAMLGDCGAGALGASLGWSAASMASRRRRGAVAAAVVGLTALSERVSFSAVIDRHPALRAVDRLGRHPT